MFIKPDKYPADEIESKPPRAIQFRTPKYNLALASYLKDIEHQFYQVLSDRGCREIAKGRNPQQRAEDLLAKVAEFDDPVFFNSDYSKMDSCIRVEHQLKIFRDFYLRVFRSKQLRRLLLAQINNRGRTKRGIVYGMKGSRCSGDFNTGFENTLINWLILKDIIAQVGKGEVYVDGDDAALILERRDEEKFVKAFNTTVPLMGFEAKLVRYETLNRLVFCQNRLIDSEVPTLTRDPIRALSNHNISLKNYPTHIWPRLEEAKMLCEYYSNPGAPMLGIVARLCLSGAKPLFDKDTEYLMASLSRQEVEVTDLARLKYHQAWGVMPYEQKLYEENPALVSCCLKSVTGRTHGTSTFEEIASKFQALGGHADYSCFSNW